MKLPVKLNSNDNIFYVPGLAHFYYLWYFLSYSFGIAFQNSALLFIFCAIILSLQIHLSFLRPQTFFIYILYLSHT